MFTLFTISGPVLFAEFEIATKLMGCFGVYRERGLRELWMMPPSLIIISKQ